MKYHNKKVAFNGEIYDSIREYQRMCELTLLENSGYISDLKRQVIFELIPTQREPDTVGKRGGVKKGKVIEKKCVYIADFTYIDNETGEYVVEDVKGIRTEAYKIKRKLMLYQHGIRITEV